MDKDDPQTRRVYPQPSSEKQLPLAKNPVIASCRDAMIQAALGQESLTLGRYY